MVTDIEQQGIKLREAGRENPDRLVEGLFKCALWRLQREIIRSVFNNPRTTVRSCTGSGKTFIAARTALAFLYLYYPSTVLTTAPTFRQVETILWREIRGALAECQAEGGMGGTITQTRLDIKENWFAIGLSTDQPERFQGFHNKHILVIGDEASGLPPAIFDAIETPLSTGHARLLYIGNPTQPIGKFRSTFDSDLYKHLHISAFDTPNFVAFDITRDDIKTGGWKDKAGISDRELEDGTWIAKMPNPYLITPLWVAQRMEEWGEGSWMYQVYVLGQFPEAGVNTLMPLGEIEQCVGVEVPTEGQRIAALDVARYGDCETVYGLRQGNKVLKIESWQHEGIHYTTGRVARHLREDNPAIIRIDAGGIGEDDCAILEGEGFNVDRVLSNSPAVDVERFLNRRAELYWLLSKRFTDEAISIPDDRKLVAQLADIRYTFKRGKEAMESKEEMRARGSKSPDRADMLALLFIPESDMDIPDTQVWRWGVR